MTVPGGPWDLEWEPDPGDATFEPPNAGFSMDDAGTSSVITGLGGADPRLQVSFVSGIQYGVTAFLDGDTIRAHWRSRISGASNTNNSVELSFASDGWERTSNALLRLRHLGLYVSPGTSPYYAFDYTVYHDFDFEYGPGGFYLYVDGNLAYTGGVQAWPPEFARFRWSFRRALGSFPMHHIQNLAAEGHGSAPVDWHVGSVRWREAGIG